MDFDTMHPDTVDPRLLLSRPLDFENMHSDTRDPHLLLSKTVDVEVVDSLIDFPSTNVGLEDFNTVKVGDMNSGITEPDLTEPGTIDLRPPQSEEVEPDSVEFGIVNSGSTDFGEVDLSENFGALADCRMSRLDETTVGLFERGPTLRLPTTSVKMGPGASTNQRMECEMIDVDGVGNNSVDVTMTHHRTTSSNKFKYGTKAIDTREDQQMHSSNQESSPSAVSQCDDATNIGYPPICSSATTQRLRSPEQASAEGSTVRKRNRSDEWREYKPKCHDESATKARVTADEWQEYRPFLEQLYVVENMKLKDVMQILETKFGFVATEKMYKKKIAQWGYMKNYKAADKERLARVFKSHQNSGEGIPQLSLRNRAVKMNRVRRFCMQKKIHKEIYDAIPTVSASKTKIALSTDLPPGRRTATKSARRSAVPVAKSSNLSSESDSTEDLFDPERPFSTASKDGRVELVLFQTKAYHQSRFGSPVKSKTFGGAVQLPSDNTPAEKEALNYNIAWESKLIYGMRSLVQQKSAQGWRMLGETCDMFHRVLDQQSQGLFRLLFFAFSDNDWSMYPDLRTHVLRFFTKVSAARLGCNHPMSIVLYHMQEQDIFANAVTPAYEVLMDVSGENLSPKHDELWRIKDNYCSMLRRRGDYAAVDSHGLRFLNQCEAVFGRLHWRTRSLLLELGDVHHWQGLHEIAECEYQDILQRAREDLGDEFPDEYCIYALQHLAMISEDRGDVAQSQEYWRQMLAGAIKKLGMHDERTTHLTVLLEKSFRRQAVDPEVWLQENFGISCV